jgi:hypothetical protein
MPTLGFHFQKSNLIWWRGATCPCTRIKTESELPPFEIAIKINVHIVIKMCKIVPSLKIELTRTYIVCHNENKTEKIVMNFVHCQVDLCTSR